MATRTEILALINGLTTGSPNTALEMRDLLTAMIDPPIGTIRIRDVSNDYITANFDGTGKGINEELGYAICNGANTTRNWNGRVPLAYGTSYLTMGATGGSKDAVLVEHTHDVAVNTNAAGSGFPAFEASSSEGTFETSSEGVSGVDKNMQPYIVTLVTVFIGYD